MRAHVLQHVAFEDIGSIAPWLSAHGAEVGYTKFFGSSVMPDLKSVDLPIIMGGPMSVNDEDQYPWLKTEKAFIRDAVGAGVPMVGICLGAQLIANALGAKVYRNREKEIGWFDVEAISGAADAFQFPEKTLVFHWHGETFDLPQGAVHLAASAACGHQAFQVGESVIGLQFHLETTPENLDSLIRHCRAELRPAPFIQTEAVLRGESENTFGRINRLMGEVLAYLTRKRR